MRLAIALAAVLAPGILGADFPRERLLQLFAFFSLPSPAAVSSYSSLQALDLTEESFSRQTLRIQGRWGAGFEVGAIFPLAGPFGLRFGFRYEDLPWGGENNPLLLHLDYVSRQPPDYTPRSVIEDRAVPWVATQGGLKSASAFLGLKISWALSGKVILALTAEGVLGRSRGEIFPLAKTTFWLGGHSVLFSESYLIFLKIPPAWQPGAGAGLELDVRLTSRLALAARLSCLLSGKLSVKPQVEKVLYDVFLTPVDKEKFDRVAPGLALEPIPLSLPSVRFGLGLVFRLGN